MCALTYCVVSKAGRIVFHKALVSLLWRALHLKIGWIVRDGSIEFSWYISYCSYTKSIHEIKSYRIEIARDLMCVIL